MIGNGVTNYTYDKTNALVKMAFAHGIIDLALHEDLMEAQCDFNMFNKLDTKCSNLLARLNKNMKHIYPYDIYRPREEYYNKNSFRDSIIRELMDITSNDEFYVWDRLMTGIDSQTDYMRRSDTKKALNVPEERTWSPCDNINYKRLPQASQFLYEDLIAADLRIAHYGGDTDGQVSMLGTQEWIDAMDLELVEEWRPWMVDDWNLGGYIERRQGIDFITIHGAGHMVPQWKRKETRLGLMAWIHRQELPKQK